MQVPFAAAGEFGYQPLLLVIHEALAFISTRSDPCQDLLKRANRDKYPHYAELEQGIAVAKRIADQANETQRKVENRNTVKALESRVDDWKGHNLAHFGELLLDDVFIVTKADVDREYHVFLFEKIILCCKEVLAHDAKKAGSISKVGKSGSLLKKQQSIGPGGMASPALPGGKKRTPLLLKGRIFLNNVTKTVIGKPSESHGRVCDWS
jgi:cell division control protein 24